MQYLLYSIEPCGWGLSQHGVLIIKLFPLKTAKKEILYCFKWGDMVFVHTGKSLCSVISLVALLKDAQTEHEHKEYIGMIETCTNELDEVLKKTNSRVDELKEH